MGKTVFDLKIVKQLFSKFLFFSLLNKLKHILFQVEHLKMLNNFVFFLILG